MIFNLLKKIIFFSFVQYVFTFDVEPYPTHRFREFSELSDEEKSAAQELGWDESTWNLPGSLYYSYGYYDDGTEWYPGGIEYLSWWYHTNMDYYDKDGDGNYYEPTPGFEEAATTLGFTEDVWDCWVNHYSSYEWSDLVEYDIEFYMTTLGWTQSKWEGTDPEPPTSSSKTYNELSDDEKTAALGTCYTQKLWDYETLPYCVDSPRPIKQNKFERSCHWVSSNAKRCNNIRGEFMKHCPNTCGVCDTHKCTETKRKWLYKTLSDGGKIYKKCTFLETNTEKRCSKKGLRLTCPATCGSYAGCE